MDPNAQAGMQNGVYGHGQGPAGVSQGPLGALLGGDPTAMRAPGSGPGGAPPPGAPGGAQTSLDPHTLMVLAQIMPLLLAHLAQQQGPAQPGPGPKPGAEAAQAPPGMGGPPGGPRGA